MSNDLITVENINAALVFVPNGLDPLLDGIEKAARSEIIDISTPEGRENCRSLAHKIAKSKTALDKMGKDLGSEYREKIAAINAERSKAVDRLQALQDEIRKPLTEFEDKEKNRVAEHETCVTEIETKMVFEFEPTIEQVQERLEYLKRFHNRDWEEFKYRAVDVIGKVTANLTARLEALQKAAKEKAELEAFRAAEAARLQKEREEKIAAEAAAKAKADAEAKAQQEAEAAAQIAAKEAQEAADRAKAEQDRIEAEKVAAEQKAAKAEADRVAAVEKAEQDAKVAAHRAEQERITAERNAQLREEAAAQKVRDEAAAAKAAEDKATAEREANIAHKKKVNNDAMKALQALFPNGELHDAMAKAVIVAIAKGEIPHVKITY